MLSQLKAAWAAGSENNFSLIAAGIAHYALLALVPALAALVLAYGVFADPETVTKHIAALYENLPPSASELIGKQLRNVSEGAEGAQGLGLIASLAVALFGARSAARALMTGLNIAFSAGEDRGLVRGNLVALDAGSVTEIRHAGRMMVQFSPEVWTRLKVIREFLFHRMYRAPEVIEMRERVTRIIRELFPMFMADATLLPKQWRKDVEAVDSETALARIVSDYIAGMTDRFAIQCHDRFLTGESGLGETSS